MREQLRGDAKVRQLTIASDSAAARLASGDYVFLESTARVWKVAAAGCRPGPLNVPFDCRLED